MSGFFWFFCSGTVFLLGLVSESVDDDHVPDVCH